MYLFLCRHSDLKSLLYRFKVGKNLCFYENILAPRRSYYNRICYKLVSVKTALYLLGINIFSVFGDDYILASSGNIQKSVFVEITEVSGVEPTVPYNCFSRFRIPVITPHDVFTTCDYLPYSLAVRLENLNINVVDGQSGRIALNKEIVVAC